MTDIVERMKKWSDYLDDLVWSVDGIAENGAVNHVDIIQEAADEITNLRTRAEKAEEQNKELWAMVDERSASITRQLARAEAAEARVKALERAAQMVMTWGDQRCPCRNEEPNPCPLCGASVENLEPCKSAENTFPPHLLFEMRRALGIRAALAQPADDVEAAPVDDAQKLLFDMAIPYNQPEAEINPWIPWTGGECPVDVPVTLRFGSGNEWTVDDPHRWAWDRFGLSSDACIIAYRVEAAP